MVHHRTTALRINFSRSILRYNYFYRVMHVLIQGRYYMLRVARSAHFEVRLCVDYVQYDGSRK